MEFHDFWKERERMCQFYKGTCKVNGCPLFDIRSRQYHHNCQLNCGDFPKEAEQIVEQWVKEHPIVTNGMKFMEIFGETFCSNMLIGSANEWRHAEYQPPKGEE